MFANGTYILRDEKTRITGWMHVTASGEEHVVLLTELGQLTPNVYVVFDGSGDRHVITAAGNGTPSSLSTFLEDHFNGKKGRVYVVKKEEKRVKV